MSAIATCFVSAKGGSGKTVTSSALGTLLSTLGFRVLLVDTDAATNGMTLLYLEQLLGRRRENEVFAHAGGLFDVGESGAPTQIEISEKLHFVPATYHMGDTEQTPSEAFRSALKALLKQRRLDYDFIFIDAQAGTDHIAKIAAASADQCVVVSEYDPVSVEGIERLKLIFAREMKPSSTWTLFNKILPEFAKVIGHGLAVARYLPPVPWDADVVRAFARRDLAINVSAPNAYTLAISEVAYYLFPDEAGSAIEGWREAAYREVISPAQKRLHELLRAEERLRAEKRSSRLAELWSPVAGLVLCITAGGVAAFGEQVTKLWGNNDILLTAILGAVGASFAALTVSKLSSVLRRGKMQTDDTSLAVVQDERDKLTAILESAKAIKISEGAGYYERRRRRPPPENSEVNRPSS
jgi:cellulose biosynthesis protein BcsQ